MSFKCQPFPLPVDKFRVLWINGDDRFRFTKESSRIMITLCDIPHATVTIITPIISPVNIGSRTGIIASLIRRCRRRRRRRSSRRSHLSRRRHYIISRRPRRHSFCERLQFLHQYRRLLGIFLDLLSQLLVFLP